MIAKLRLLAQSVEDNLGHNDGIDHMSNAVGCEDIDSDNIHAVIQNHVAIDHVDADGCIRTPDEARAALQYGALAVVVGSAITRPQLITRTFSEALK